MFLPLASVCISKCSPKLNAQSFTFLFGNRSECALNFCFLQPRSSNILISCISVCVFSLCTNKHALLSHFAPSLQLRGCLSGHVEQLWLGVALAPRVRWKGRRRYRSAGHVSVAEIEAQHCCSKPSICGRGVGLLSGAVLKCWRQDAHNLSQRSA